MVIAWVGGLGIAVVEGFSVSCGAGCCGVLVACWFLCGDCCDLDVGVVGVVVGIDVLDSVCGSQSLILSYVFFALASNIFIAFSSSVRGL
jgi:hypothetical protein